MLLRHREARGAFLNPASKVVQGLLTELEVARDRNLHFAERNNQSASRAQGMARTKWLAGARRLHNNAEIIIELTEYLHFKSRDPNIIRRIDLLDEE